MKSFLTIIFLVSTLTSCTTYSNKRKWVPTVQKMPSDVPVGSSPELVLRKMGEPSDFEQLPDGREIWTYNDLWWDDRSWGSWKLYFNSDLRLSGWKLIDPPSNQEFNREAFFSL